MMTMLNDDLRLRAPSPTCTRRPTSPASAPSPTRTRARPSVSDPSPPRTRRWRRTRASLTSSLRDELNSKMTSNFRNFLQKDVSCSQSEYTFWNRTHLTVEIWSLDMSQNQICTCLGTGHIFLHIIIKPLEQFIHEMQKYFRQKMV